MYKKVYSTYGRNLSNEYAAGVSIYFKNFQENELNPDDAWLMRVAGGEEAEHRIDAALEDDQFSFKVHIRIVVQCSSMH